MRGEENHAWVLVKMTRSLLKWRKQPTETIMANYFVPYSGRKPAALQINGHRVLLFSRSKETFSDELGLLGADRIKRVRATVPSAEKDIALEKLSQTAEAGLVLVPPHAPIAEIIRNLESELPWVQ